MSVTARAHGMGEPEDDTVRISSFSGPGGLNHLSVPEVTRHDPGPLAQPDLPPP